MPSRNFQRGCANWPCVFPGVGVYRVNLINPKETIKWRAPHSTEKPPVELVTSPFLSNGRIDNYKQTLRQCPAHQQQYTWDAAPAR